MAELFIGKPLFAGQGEQDQVSKIFSIVGRPNEKVWPGCSKLRHFEDYVLLGQA